MNSKNLSKAINRMLAILLTAAMVAGSFTVPVKAEENVIEEEPGYAADNNAAGEVAEVPDEPVDNEKKLVPDEEDILYPEDVSDDIRLEVNLDKIGGTYGDTKLDALDTTLEAYAYVVDPDDETTKRYAGGASEISYTYSYSADGVAEYKSIGAHANVKKFDNGTNSTSGGKQPAGFYKVTITVNDESDNVKICHGEKSFIFERKKLSLDGTTFSAVTTNCKDGYFTPTYATNTDNTKGIVTSPSLVYTPKTGGGAWSVVPETIDYVTGADGGKTTAAAKAINGYKFDSYKAATGKGVTFDVAGTEKNSLSNATVGAVNVAAEEADCPRILMDISNDPNFTITGNVIAIPFVIGKVGTGTTPPNKVDIGKCDVKVEQSSTKSTPGVLELDDIIFNAEGTGYETVVGGELDTFSTWSKIISEAEVAKNSAGKYVLNYTVAKAASGTSDAVSIPLKLNIANYTDPVAVTINFSLADKAVVKASDIELVKTSFGWTGDQPKMAIKVTDADQADAETKFDDNTYSLDAWFYSVDNTKGSKTPIGKITTITGASGFVGSEGFGENTKSPYGQGVIQAPANVGAVGDYVVKLRYSSTLGNKETNVTKEIPFTITKATGNVLTLKKESAWAAADIQFAPGGSKLPTTYYTIHGANDTTAGSTAITASNTCTISYEYNLIDEDFVAADLTALQGDASSPIVAGATRASDYSGTAGALTKVYQGQPYVKVTVNDANHDNAYGYMTYTQKSDAADVVAGTSGSKDKRALERNADGNYVLPLEGIFKIGGTLGDPTTGVAITPNGGYTGVTVADSASGTAVNTGDSGFDNAANPTSVIVVPTSNWVEGTSKATVTVTADFTGSNWKEDGTIIASSTKVGTAVIEISDKVVKKKVTFAVKDSSIIGSHVYTGTTLLDTAADGSHMNFTAKVEGSADVVADPQNYVQETYYQLASEVYAASSEAIKKAVEEKADTDWNDVFRRFPANGGELYTCMAATSGATTKPSTPLAYSDVTVNDGHYKVVASLASGKATTNTADELVVSVVINKYELNNDNTTLTIADAGLDDSTAKTLKFLGTQYKAYAGNKTTWLDTAVVTNPLSQKDSKGPSGRPAKADCDVTVSDIFRKGDRYYVTVTAAVKETTANYSGTVTKDVEVAPYEVKTSGANADGVTFYGTGTYDYTGETIRPGIKSFSLNHDGSNYTTFTAAAMKKLVDNGLVKYTVTYESDENTTKVGTDKVVKVVFASDGLIYGTMADQKYNIQARNIKIPADISKRMFADADSDKVVEIELPVKAADKDDKEFDVTYAESGIVKTTDANNIVKKTELSGNTLKVTIKAGAAKTQSALFTITPAAENCKFVDDPKATSPTPKTSYTVTVTVADSDKKAAITYTGPESKTYDGENVDFMTATIRKDGAEADETEPNKKLKYTITKKDASGAYQAYGTVDKETVGAGGKGTIRDAGDYKVVVAWGSSVTAYDTDQDEISKEFSIAKKAVEASFEVVDGEDNKLDETVVYDNKPVAVKAKVTFTPEGVSSTDKVENERDYNITGEATLAAVGNETTVKVTATDFSNYTFEEKSQKVKLIAEPLPVIESPAAVVTLGGRSIKDKETIVYTGDAALELTTKLMDGENVIDPAAYELEVKRDGFKEAEVKQPGRYMITFTSNGSMYEFETVAFEFTITEKPLRKVESIGFDSRNLRVKYNELGMETTDATLTVEFDLIGETVKAADIDYSPKLVGGKIVVTPKDGGIISFTSTGYGDGSANDTIEYKFWVDGDETKTATIKVRNMPESTSGEADPGTPAEEPSEYEKPGEDEYPSFDEGGEISVTGVITKKCTYNGKPQEPAVKVTGTGTDGKKLVAGTDYKVTYANNVNATNDGEAIAIISGIGKYAGSKEVKFAIAPKKLGGTVVAGAVEKPESGKPSAEDIEGAISVYDGTKLLNYGDDYEIGESSIAEGKGKYDFVITYKGNYTGTKKASVKMAVENDLALCDVEITFGGENEANYTGKAFTIKNGNMSIKVTDPEGKEVTATAYSVTYKNNTNVGVGTVTLKGKKPYAGSKVVRFTINRNENEESIIDAKNIIVNNGKALTYTGKLLKPSVKVQAMVNGKLKNLSKNKDYVVYYSSELNAGTGYVVIRPIGNYEGQDYVDKEFTINRADFKKTSIKKNSEKRSGIYFNGKKLVEGEDFTAKITSVDTKGKYTITVSVVPEDGSRNFQGSATKTIKGTKDQIDWQQLFGVEKPEEIPE